MIYFIGYSFGKSDHYYFLELLELIRYQEDKYKGESKVILTFYYHDPKVIREYIQNMRLFLGEESLTRFSRSKRIQFVKYDDAIK